MTPQTEVVTQGGWQETTPATVGGFTAAGYFFAREIEKELDVPIGLIGCNWGGTRIDPWIPPAGWQAVRCSALHSPRARAQDSAGTLPKSIRAPARPFGDAMPAPGQNAVSRPGPGRAPAAGFFLFA